MKKRAPSLSAHYGASTRNVHDNIERDIIRTEFGHPLSPEEACCEKARTIANQVSVLQAANTSLSQALALERKARAQAEEGNRAKDEFLATVSHELRTPLTAILGWSRVLSGEKQDGSKYARGLETIERNAHAQEQLINDLLDVTRIKTGKLNLQLELVQPSSVLDSAIDTARPLADSKSIRLQCAADSIGNCILGDPVRLQQVMWNLLSNAIKFTPEGGSVMVQLEQVDSHIEIKITDTGQGISADFLPHIFERFRQPERTTRAQGLGLGLAIVRHLVELHGGEVHAESSGEGRGSSFTVRLPLITVQASAGRVAEASTTEKGGSPRSQWAATRGGPQ